MKPKPSQAKIAKALADSKRMTDREAADLNGIGVSTLRRWRSEVKDDSPIAAEIEHNLRTDVQINWADGVPSAIASAVDFLTRAGRELDPESYRAVDSVTRAMSALVEAEAMYKMMQAREKPQTTPD